MSATNIVPDFSCLRVAVAGDLIADHYLFARPTRLSREAPVIVMRHDSERIGAGGAANVACNLRALGANTDVHGVVGMDQSGRELKRLLEAESVEARFLRTASDWVTPTKTRVLAAQVGRTFNQVLRIDREPDERLPMTQRAGLAESVRGLNGKIDALLLSDYGYGAVGEELAEAASSLQSQGAIVVLDPRSNYGPFRNVTAITPNLGELAAATGRSVEDLDDWNETVRAATEFRREYQPRWLLVTMGNRGMALFSEEAPDGTRVSAAGPESVVDVSGAGDTAAAAFTLGLAAGIGGPSAMRLANAAAGIVVMENGAAVCELAKLRSALSSAPHPVGKETLLRG